MEAVLVADGAPAPSLDTASGPRLARAQTTSRNFVTAWWDASQIYGFDERSPRRVKRDPNDPAKLLVVPVSDRDLSSGLRRAMPARRGAPMPIARRSSRSGRGRSRSPSPTPGRSA